jgi:hypothetical protein
MVFWLHTKVGRVAGDVGKEAKDKVLSQKLRVRNPWVKAGKADKNEEGRGGARVRTVCQCS